jgi:predicted methyltransferase
MNTLSANAKMIVTALATSANSPAKLAEQLGVKIQVVTGSMAGLKKSGIVTFSEGVMALTAEGKKLATPAKVNKTTKALAIYNEGVAAKSPRKTIITRYMNELGLSKAGASTYYQNAVKATKK